MSLSMKELDVRLKAVEDLVFADSGQDSGLEKMVLDAMSAIIVSLRHVRQQGAYILSNELEEKYFPDGDVEEVGDVFTTAEKLNRAGGGK